MTNCPHSYPQVVDRDSRRRSLVYQRGHRGPGLVTDRSAGSRPSGHPRFVVWSPSRIETALPEANSFISECQLFCNIGRRFLDNALRCVTAVTAVNHSARDGRGLTQRNLVSTLEQSPERGDTAATQALLETAPASKRDGRAYQRRPRPTGPSERGMRMPYATRRDSRGQGQADLPAQQPAPRAGAWVPASDANPGRPGHRVEPASQGPPFVDCVIRRRV